MNRKPALLAFGALFAVQALPPVSLAVQRTQALHQGKPVLLAVETRDPRDVFRGEYSVLAYGIGNLQAVELDPDSAASCPDGPAASGTSGCRPRPGQQVFVTLEEDGSGVHRAVRASLRRPAEGTTYATGKLQGPATVTKAEQACGSGACLTGRVAYGIENWYGPQGRPAQLDRVPRGDVRVEARVGPGGSLRLDGIQVRGETFARTARLWRTGPLGLWVPARAVPWAHAGGRHARRIQAGDRGGGDAAAREDGVGPRRRDAGP